MLAINCDLGEFNLKSGRSNPDEEIFLFIQICNIACGYHAGGPSEMFQSLKLARKYGVKVGVHPSFPDLTGFGRHYMNIPYEDLKNLILYQISALKGMAESMGMSLYHVKPHGALYNAAMKHEKEANAIIEATKSIDRDLVILCQPNSILSEISMHNNMQVLKEGFADRLYNDDLSLVSRDVQGSILDTKEKVIEQIKALNNGLVTTRSGTTQTYQVDTLCIHSENSASISALKTLMIKM